MKKILVTGGAGFIGSHVVNSLLKQGHEVIVLDNLFTGDKRNLYEAEKNPQFTFVLHDVTRPFWAQVDEIYNLACPASPIHYQKNPVETTRTALLGLINMLELALKTKAKLLHASTSEVYGDPQVHPQKEEYWGNVNPIGTRACYDEGKRAGETLCADYVREYGVDVRMVRIFNTYGTNMHPYDGRVVSNFIVQALKGEPLTIYGKGDQTRSFQHVDDLLEALFAYMALPKKELLQLLEKHGWKNVPVLNVGNPKEFSIKELADEILSLLPESKSGITHSALPSDDPKQRQPDITLAKSVLSWSPKIALKEGLQKTIPYFRERLAANGQSR